MSDKGIEYALNTSFGNNGRLLIFYDFSGMSGRHIGNELDGPINHGVIENCDPSTNTGVYSGIVCGFGSSAVASKLFTTGTFLLNNQANLQESNIKVTGTVGIGPTPTALPYSSCSTLFDLEFNEGVSDCVLFGSLEKTSSTIGDEVVTGAKGYNFGLNDRGKLFYQGFDSNGDYIHTASSIDLAKRNVVGFSLGKNKLSITRFDYLNHLIEKEDFTVDTSFIAANEEFYLGGAQQYFRGGPAGVSGEFETSNVSLNSFCLLSGYIPPSAMFSLGSGLIGDYFSDTQAAVSKRRITGYSQTQVYKTGITGYDYENTGSINISTGRYMLTGNFFGATSVNTGEGDRYFLYRSFDNALSNSGIKSFVKEEVGFLHPDSGYQYIPSGEGAFATLGLRDVEGAVNEYVEQRGMSGAATVAVTLYGSRIQTGILSEVSGLVQTPIYETMEETPSITTSGVRLGGLSEKFKKNYIYYLGDRV